MWPGSPASVAGAPGRRRAGHPWWAGASRNSPRAAGTSSPNTRQSCSVSCPEHSSELFGFGIVGVADAVVVVGPVRVHDVRRVEAGRAVLEGQAHLCQLHLDLVDRLRAEVADVEQVRLAARDELA